MEPIRGPTATRSDRREHLVGADALSQKGIGRLRWFRLKQLRGRLDRRLEKLRRVRMDFEQRIDIGAKRFIVAADTVEMRLSIVGAE